MTKTEHMNPGAVGQRGVGQRGVGQRRRVAWVALGLAALVLTAFWGVCLNGFVLYDDIAYVTENVWVQQGLTWAGVARAFTTLETAFYQPLTLLSHMADCQIYGVNAWGHHLTSLVLHVLNTILLFLALRRLSGALWPSALAAALFGVHPLAVESVAWVAQRKDVLSTFFWFATLWAYAGYVAMPNAKRYALVFVFLLLGLLAKSMLVTVPCVLLLLDYWPLRRVEALPWRGVARRRWAWLVIEKAPLFALVGAFCVISYVAQRRAGALVDVEAITTGMRVNNAVVSYVRYLQKMLWPFGLAVYYPHPHGALAAWKVIGAAVLLGGISTIAVMLAGKRPYVLVGWLWFVGTLVPVIGLVQIAGHAMADRYAYVTLVGLYIVVAWGLRDFAARGGSRRQVAVLVAAVVLLGLVPRTASQVRYWRNTETLFRHATQVTPTAYIPLTNLGCALHRQGRYAEAEAIFERVVELFPESVAGHVHLANAYTEQHRYAEAIGVLREALQLDPNHVKAHVALGAALFGAGNIAEAEQCYRRVLELDPANLDAQSNMAAVLLARGAYPEAASVLKDMVAAHPEDAMLHSNLGIALAEQGRLDEAFREFEKALRLEPDYQQAQMALEHYRKRQRSE